MQSKKIQADIVDTVENAVTCLAAIETCPKMGNVHCPLAVQFQQWPSYKSVGSMNSLLAATSKTSVHAALHITQ